MALGDSYIDNAALREESQMHSNYINLSKAESHERQNYCGIGYGVAGYDLCG